MAGKLEINEVAEGKYQLSLVLDVELPFSPSRLAGPARLNHTTFTSQPDSHPQQPRQERLALTVPEVAQKLSMSRAHVYDLLRTGRLESIKIGKLRRIPLSALQSYIDRLLAEHSRPHLPD